MLKFFFLIIALVPVAGHADTQTWIAGFEKGVSAGRAAGKPIFVDVMASWCGYCRKMRETVFPTPEFSEVARDYVLVRVNAEMDPAIGKFNVQGLPTMLILDKNGYMLNRIEGYTETPRLVSLMKGALRKANTEDRLVRDAKEQPGILSSYKAGLYFADTGNQIRAREYFLSAWEAGKESKDPRSFDSLYNAAVSSMELEDHDTAIKLWSEYVMRHPVRDKDLAYAHYFRGLSLRRVGKQEQARGDIEYAAANLPDGEDKQQAARMAKLK